MAPRSSERGTALLLSILATAILGAGLMSVLMLSGSERRSVMNLGAQTDAYAIAQAGLEVFVATRSSSGFTASPAAAYESTRVNVTGGYADVVLQRIRPAAGSQKALYVVRSHGRATSPQLSGTPLAGRRVAQLARWGGGTIAQRASFTAIAGLTKHGASGTISGVDYCAASGSIAGVAVPTAPGYVQATGAPIPVGSVNVLSLGATMITAAAAVDLDWSAIVAGSVLPADVVVGTWPSFADASYWPIVRVNGDFTLPSDGRGILIVTGSLTMGARTWNGIVLVGNRLIIAGNAVIDGATYTGLNAKLGQTPAASVIGSHNARFRFSSCNVSMALAKVGGLSLMPTTWMDNWAGW